MTERSVARVALTAAQAADILELVSTASAADGVAPLSEHVLLHLRYGGGSGERPRDFTVTVDGEIAAYAYLDPPEPEVSGELVVDPGRRGQGIGRALVGELAAAANGHPLQLWAHGDLPAAQALARTSGFEPFRSLWQLRRPLRDPMPQPKLPAGCRLRTFSPGQDEDEWLSLNGRAFAKHPEQGAWTRHDLDLREREPWFDPAGFFIAERDGQMTGFHWTKVHPPQVAGPGVGEVYVVGVDPAEQGSGLGRALTLAGLHHLRELGLETVILYVDADNTPAVRMYEALGFTRARTDVMYRRD
jgi:mycothiol synthase